MFLEECQFRPLLNMKKNLHHPQIKSQTSLSISEKPKKLFKPSNLCGSHKRWAPLKKKESGMRSDSGLEVCLSLHRLTQEHTGSKRFDALNQAAEASSSGLLMQLPNGAAKNFLVQVKEEVKQITGRWREEGACLCTET
jgi:hypothetical protein